MTSNLFVFAIALFSCFSSSSASYSNTSVPYSNDLECATCIRSGNNFCVWVFLEEPKAVTTWNCTQDQLTEGNFKTSTGVSGKYFCSYGMDDINAIVG